MQHISVRELLRISLGFVLLLLSVIGSSCNLGGGVRDLAPFKGRRSLLSLPSDHDTHLFAKLDGTINLVDLESKTVLWSFPSGPPIYSSYQAPANHDSDTENASETTGRYFVDCGDDWKLFAHTELGRVKLDKSAEEFVQITPHIAEDGGVVLGSKKTTVFLVDANTGRIIYIYRSPHPSPTSLSNEGSKSIMEWEISSFVEMKPDDRPLYILRTDYSLSSFAPYSGEVMWNVTVAEIGAAYLCKDNENSIGNELPSEPGVHFNMPLTCESKAYVYRLRNSRILNSLPATGMLSEDRNEELLLPTPSRDDLLHKPAKFDEFLEFYNKNDVETALSLPQNSGIYGSQDVKKPSSNGLSLLSGGPRVPLVPFLLIIIGFFAYGYPALVGKSNNQVGEPNAIVASSKKKKPRKSGKNSSLQKVDENEYSSMEDERKPLLNFNGLIDGDADGRAIGKLFVSSKEIAKGSNGTIVFEGLYEGRKVAVKRLVKAHHDVAYKEIQNLIASDQHPNIVRWYGVEYNQDFVFLALERCACSLNDLIQMHSDSFEKPTPAEGQMTKALAEYKMRLESMKVVMHGINLWRPNGYPSSILLKLMRDVVHGLVHLHELGIIHRDLKPQNVLIITERPLCAKLSDMGISKCLVGDMSSLGHHATGYGSPGWQAPEQLLHGRQTRAVDMFSLGCVLFFCITGGKHPFGSHLERDANVAKNHVDLFLIEYIPEALDLLSRLLDPHAERRPKASKVLHHPLFWSSETRLSFLRDASDRVESEGREADSGVLKTLESKAPLALGGKWVEKMEPAFITNIGMYRRYKYDSVRDLLRVIRNKLNHYRELPTEIQELLGSVPEGFDDYFGSRFPKFLIEVYNVMQRHCAEEEWFQKYLNS